MITNPEMKTNYSNTLHGIQLVHEREIPRQLWVPPGVTAVLHGKRQSGNGSDGRYSAGHSSRMALLCGYN